MTETDRNQSDRELRTFGRRRGRRLSPRQERLLRDVLPRVALDVTEPPPTSIAELFDERVSQAWLEIGFGGGEHLLWQAERNTGVGLIGSEAFQDGVVKVLSAIEANRLANIRLHPDDVRPLLRWLPRSSIDRAFILFPDPWLKKRHAKRRLVTRPFLDLLAAVLKPGAELRLATDIGSYVEAALVVLTRHPEFGWQVSGPADWRTRPPDWPETRYEQKAVREGRRCYYLQFFRL